MGLWSSQKCVRTSFLQQMALLRIDVEEYGYMQLVCQVRSKRNIALNVATYPCSAGKHS
eukprot:m.399631 g.399631  ORF g.399631 m.399631 type:complete len:59 (-) comp21151_c1_seq12:208-384(-)